jgi:DNA repair photolyase
VPGISSKPVLMERTIKAIADHGACFVGSNVMFLEGGTRDHFMRFLADAYPQLVEGYAQLYAGKYASASYRAEVRHVIGLLQARHGLPARERGSEPTAPAAIQVAEQQMLGWREA